jgi:hypothetical protein
MIATIKLNELQTTIHDMLVNWPVKFDNAAWQLVKALIVLRDTQGPFDVSERLVMDRAMYHVLEATKMVTDRGYGNTWLAFELTGLAEALGHKQLEIRWPLVPERLPVEPDAKMRAETLKNYDALTLEPEPDSQAEMSAEMRAEMRAKMLENCGARTPEPADHE